MHLAWLIFLIFVFFDTTQAIGASAIRASGKQGAGSIITGFAYWGLGIPITCLLVFWQTLGIKGIWIGPTVSVFFITCAYQVIVMKTDWQNLIKEAEKQRAEAKKVDGDSDTKDDQDDNYEKAVN